MADRVLRRQDDPAMFYLPVVNRRYRVFSSSRAAAAGLLAAPFVQLMTVGKRRGATPVEPKAISPTDPAARYTAAADKPAVYAYSDNYLIDLKHAVIMDVEATMAIRKMA